MTLFSTTTRSSRTPSVLRRRAIGLATAAALVFSLSACGEDFVGAAADVGGTSIGESELVAATDATLAGLTDPETGAQPGPADRAFANRRILTDQIRDALLPKIADSAGVSVSKKDVTNAIGGDVAKAAEAFGVPADEVPDMVRDLLLVTKIAQQDAEKSETVTNVEITSKVITTYPDRAAAVAAREQFLSDPAAMDAAIAANPQTAGQQKFNLVQDPGAAVFGIFAAEPGDIVLVSQGAQVLLVRIESRVESETDQLAASMSGQQNMQGRMGVAWLAMAKRAKDIDISVNPRFGIWDPAAMTVAPSSAGL